MTITDAQAQSPSPKEPRQAAPPPVPPPPPPVATASDRDDSPERAQTRAELCAALRVSVRTVTNWVAAGCPHERRPDGQLLFDVAEVRAWRALRDDLPGDEGPPLLPIDSKERVKLAQALTQVRISELALEAERALKDLSLAEQIRAVTTLDDLAKVGKEATALVSEGRLSPTRARSIQGLLHETRQAMTKQRQVVSEDTAERAFLASPEGIALLEAFEWIVSDERRAALLEHARREAALDEEEHPNLDLAGDLPAEGEDEPMPEEGRRDPAHS